MRKVARKEIIGENRSGYFKRLIGSYLIKNVGREWQHAHYKVKFNIFYHCQTEGNKWKKLIFSM